MAAQSEAARVKVSPFSTRGSAQYYIALPGGWHHGLFRLRRGVREVLAEYRSLRNRRPRGLTRKYSVNELSILDDGESTDKHKLNPFRIAQRFFIRCSVNDAIGIEYGDVRVRPQANSSFVFEDWRALIEPLRRHQSHLAKRGHQIQRLFFSHVMSQHPRKRRLTSWMNFGSRKGHAVAGDNDSWVRNRRARGLLRNRKNNNRAPFLAIFFKTLRCQAFTD